jgi:Putative restriction endonuclease
MTTFLTKIGANAIVYPSSDGEPVAETYVHLYALLVTLEVLTQYLQGQQATVLANQFLYYAEGFPKLRVAPDVMVILGVNPGGRDNYKIWEEQQVPAVVFEITSKGTRREDLGAKKTLYENLGVQEYWLFDPKGEWLPQQLQGYRLQAQGYRAITDGISQPLQLRLESEGELIGFYRLDTNEKLLIPRELAAALAEEKQAKGQERQAREQEQLAREQAEAEIVKLKAKLRDAGIDPEA